MSRSSGYRKATSAGIEPEIRHHGGARSRQLGRDDTRERVRRLAVATHPRHRNAGEIADVAHAVVDADDVAHAGAGGFCDRFGVLVERVRLKLAAQAKPFEMVALRETGHRSVALERQQARAEHE